MKRAVFRRYIFSGGVLTLLLALDRVLKQVAQSAWSQEPLATGPLALTYFENRYIAFSIPFSGIALEIVIGAIILGLLWFLAQRLRKQVGIQEWGASFLLAGALGNFYDRLRYGFVIDYVQIGPFPVFNLADALITLGAILIGISLWRHSARQS